MKKNRLPPVIVGVGVKEYRGYTWKEEIKKPSVKMRNGKNGFQPVLIELDQEEEEVDFLYTYKFSENELKDLLQLLDKMSN